MSAIRVSAVYSLGKLWGRRFGVARYVLKRLRKYNAGIEINSYDIVFYDIDSSSTIGEGSPLLQQIAVAHHGVIYQLQWSKKDDKLVSCSGDGICKVWNVAGLFSTVLARRCVNEEESCVIVSFLGMYVCYGLAPFVCRSLTSSSCVYLLLRGIGK
jgi:hypothetical protein